MMSEGNQPKMFFFTASLLALCSTAYVSLLIYREFQPPVTTWTQEWKHCLKDPGQCAKNIKKDSDNFTVLLKALEKEFMGSQTLSADFMKKVAQAIIQEMLKPDIPPSSASATSSEKQALSLFEKQLMESLAQDPRARKQLRALADQNIKPRPQNRYPPAGSRPQAGQRNQRPPAPRQAPPPGSAQSPRPAPGQQ